jgi:hypothetical protein
MSSSSIIGGGIGPTIAFLLAVAWYTLKDRRDIGRHDQAVIVAMRMELAANLPVVEKNQSDVTEELERLPRGESLLNPLEPLEAGFWNLAKLNVRRAMARHPGHPYEQGFSLKLWPQRLGQPLKSATLAWSKRHSSHRSSSACAACQASGGVCVGTAPCM